MFCRCKAPENCNGGLECVCLPIITEIVLCIYDMERLTGLFFISLPIDFRQNMERATRLFLFRIFFKQFILIFLLFHKYFLIEIHTCAVHKLVLQIKYYYHHPILM